jgi:hypothetical protein
MKPLQERVAEYLELDGKRTPGEWKRDPWDSPSMQVIAMGNEVIVYHGRHQRQVNERVVPNFKFIVASANLAPSLIREQQEEIDRLREAISEFLEAFDRQSPKPRVSITAQAKKVALRRALTAPTITPTKEE